MSPDMLAEAKRIKEANPDWTKEQVAGELYLRYLDKYNKDNPRYITLDPKNKIS